MTGWIRRLTRYCRRPRLNEELADEIRMHLELREQALIADGMDPREAAYEARRRFGNVVGKREESREMWVFSRFETIVRDLAYAARALRRAPAFAAIAIVALGIGIGASLSVFTLINAVLLRPLPVAHPEELAILKWRSTASARMPAPSLSGNYTSNNREQSSTSFSLPTFETLRRERAATSRIIGFAGDLSFNVALGEAAETVDGQAVSGNYFDTLGLTPAAGRLLTESDDTPGAAPVAVISDALWRTRFAASPQVVGRVMSVNAQPVTIVGVMPKGFTSTLQVDAAPAVTVPLAMRAVLERAPSYREARSWWVLMMARVPRGSELSDVRSQLEGSFRRSVAEGNPQLQTTDLPTLELLPGEYGQQEARNGMRQPLRIMALIVAVVQLVACAIVANLLLARGQVRRREIAVRAAIGASRARIVGHLLTEGLVLACAGTAVGILIARWITSAVAPAVSGSDALKIDLSPDWRVVLFTAGLTTMSAFLFALVPAIRATRWRLTSDLQTDVRTMTPGRDRRSLARVLVAVQVALSVVLVTVAALLVRTTINLHALPAGFDPSNLLIFRVDPMKNGYTAERARELYGTILERLAAIPGVRSATLMSNTLIGAGGSSTIAALPSDPPVEPGTADGRAYFDTHGAFVLSVGDGFFAAMGIPVVQGRPIEISDTSESPRVVVVNQSLAKRLFGTTDALGRQLKTNFAANTPVFDVVGVVADAKYTSLRREAPPTMYFSYRQRPASSPTFAVKTAGDPLATVTAVTEVVRQVDPTLPLFALRTQEQQIQQSLRRERLLARLATVLGAVTWLLCAIGLFGLLAYEVTRRTQEIGLRMALGAEARFVRWMVMRQSLALTLTGLAVGVPAALWSGRVLESSLFGLSPYDPPSLAIVAATMMLAAGAAAYFPARRAARVDPVIALRAD